MNLARSVATSVARLVAGFTVGFAGVQWAVTGGLGWAVATVVALCAWLALFFWEFA